MEERPRWVTAIWVLGVVLLPQPSLAQVGTRPERLYLNHTGVLLGSTRMIALGGAYVGVAEDAAGFSSNLAALAHRAPDLERDWDVGLTLSWLDLPLLAPARRDLDNDGEADEAQSSRQLLVGVLLQYQRFGLGWYMRSAELSYCTLIGVGCQSPDYLQVGVANSALAAAVALGRDDFIVGLGVYSAEASFRHHNTERRYGNTGVELGALFRPNGLSYRVGLSVKPQVVAPYRPRQSEPPMLADRPLFSAVVSPAVVSLGGSMRLGEGSHRYNRLSPAARKDVLSRFGEGWIRSEPLGDEPPGRVLISAQLDLISATESTLPFRAFTSLAPEQLIGQQLYLVPRAGLEHDTLAGRLRMRVGSLIEPSPFPGKLPRPHLTGGFELFLLEYWQRWSVSASFDVANRYYNLGLSIGFWRT